MREGLRSAALALTATIALTAAPSRSFAQSAVAAPAAEFAPVVPHADGSYPVVPVASPTPAQVEDGRVALRTGVRLAGEGESDGALVQFLRAYRLSGSAALLFNLAAAHESQRQYALARSAMEAFLRDAPESVREPRRADAEALIQRVRGRVGTVVVAPLTPNVRIFVDGLEVPAQDIRAGAQLSVGRHRVALEAQGYERVDREIEVSFERPVTIRDALVERGARLTVVTPVPDAEVYVDGVRVGRTPLEAPINVPTRGYTIELRREGYAPARQVNDATAAANAGPSPVWAPELRPLDPLPRTFAARLRVRSEPLDESVRATLDGSPVAIDEEREVPEGAHELRVEGRQRTPARERITVRAHAGSEATALLALSPEGRAARSSVFLVAGGLTWGLGTAVFIAAGAVALGYYGPLIRDDQVAYESDRCAEVLRMRLPPGMCLDYTSRIEQNQSFQNIAWAVVGVGGATMLAGILIATVAPRVGTGPEQSTVRVRPYGSLDPARGGAQAGLAVHF